MADQVIQFEGTTHIFPGDFTQQDIQRALASAHPKPGVMITPPGGQPPGPAKPPLPPQLAGGVNTDGGHRLVDTATGRPLARQGDNTPSPIVQGVEQMAGAGVRTGSGPGGEGFMGPQQQGTDTRTTGQRFVGGLNKVVKGAGGAIAPVALPAAAATAGVPATLAGGIMGAAASEGTQNALQKAGVKPEYAEAGGNAAGLASGLATGSRLSGSTADEVTDAAAAPLRAFNKYDPETALVRAWRPVPSNPGFTNRLRQTIARVKEANGGTLPRTNEEAIPMLQNGVNKLNADLEPYFQRAEAGGVTEPGDFMVQATADYLSSHTRPSQATKAQDILNKAKMDFGGRNYAPREMKAELERMNTELYDVFKQSDPRQESTLTDIPTGVLMAQRDAMANKLYDKLAPDEDGAGPRTIQQHIGDMLDMLHRANDRKNSIRTEQPVSRLESIERAATAVPAAPLRMALRSHGSSPFEDATHGQSNVLIKKAFKAVREPANASPQPASPQYPFYANPAPEGAPQLGPGTAPFTQGTSVPDIAGRPKGPGAPESRMGYLLPAGNPQQGQGVIITPPPGASRTGLTGEDQSSFEQVPLSPRVGAAPPDTSFVRSAPGMTAPPRTDRALPPATTRMQAPLGSAGPSPTTGTGPFTAGRGPNTNPISPATPPDTSGDFSVTGKYPDIESIPPVDQPQPPGGAVQKFQMPAPQPPKGVPGNEPLGTFHKRTIEMRAKAGKPSPEEVNRLAQTYRNNGMSEEDIEKKIQPLLGGDDITEYIPAFRKGGVITKPTLGLIGEAGPEARVPLTSAHATTPEKPETIQVQLNQLLGGNRKVVMVPRGTDKPKTPKGMKTYQDAQRNHYIFNPKEISHKDIDTASSTNNLTEILGAKDGGMGAPDKSQLGPGTKAVVGETKNGTETQATATDSKHLDRTISQTRKVTPPDGLVDVKPVEEQIAARKKDTPSSVSKEMGGDQGKAVDKIRGSIDVPLDDIGTKEADDLGRGLAAKGGVHRIISSPMLRSRQTVQGMVKYNPQAKVTISSALRPWPLGGLEGSPTEQALPELKRLVTQAPAEVPRGRGRGSTESPQSFNQFTNRVLSETRRIVNEHDAKAPDEVWDLAAHKSIINLIHAYIKAGTKPNLVIDKRHFFERGTVPGSLYRMGQGMKDINEVDLKGKGKLSGGVYLSRHGSTSFNAPSSAAKPGKSVS